VLARNTQIPYREDACATNGWYQFGWRRDRQLRRRAASAELTQTRKRSAGQGAVLIPRDHLDGDGGVRGADPSFTAPSRQFYNLIPSLTALENVALVTEIA